MNEFPDFAQQSIISTIYIHSKRVMEGSSARDLGTFTRERAMLYGTYCIQRRIVMTMHYKRSHGVNQCVETIRLDCLPDSIDACSAPKLIQLWPASLG